VEQKNILSQFHTKMSLGKNKAKAFAQGMKGLFGVEVEAIPYKIDFTNAEVLLRDADLVIDCTDNIEARELMLDSHRRFKVPCLHGALAADGQFGRIIWSEEFKPDEAAEGEVTCEDGEFLPFIGAVASTIAVEAQIFLKTGKKRSFQLTPGGMIRLA
jgi:molybdopterin/thiamine biosynthesis adenylyltransferase